MSRNVDCCTRKMSPLTETPWPTAGVQPWNQLLVSVRELAPLAATHRPCRVNLTVSFCSVITSFPVPMTAVNVLSKRDP